MKIGPQLNSRSSSGGSKGSRVSHVQSANAFVIHPPWDILRELDVFKNGELLHEQTSESDLSHWAPNCATYSRAREIPIKGVAKAPQPVRSEDNPEGIPAEMAKMSRRQLTRLKLDTKMANLAGESAWESAEKMKGFTLEHPLNSIAWHLESWQKLRARHDVHFIEYHTCMFEGSRRKKNQALLTNRSAFQSHIGRKCRGGAYCDRTGLKHLKWRPTVAGGKVTQFITGEEREYPVGFCTAYGRAVLEEYPNGVSFVEVFSGPNAPLSQAIGLAAGVKVPGAPVRQGKGVRNELQTLAQLAIPKPPDQPQAPQRKAEGGDANRVVGLESGRQPGYGKRCQLIPDGLNDPLAHFDIAKCLEHPFNSEAGLKDWHADVLESLSAAPELDTAFRLKTLQVWEDMSKSRSVKQRQEEHDRLACDNAKKLGLKPRTALMEVLQERYHIEDVAVPLLCRTGLPIVGPALESPFFQPYHVPTPMTIQELLSTSVKRRDATLRRVKVMGEAGGLPMAEAIWSKTMKEVEEGSMAGPFTKEEMFRKHGRFFNVVPSFGLQQGEKYRRIDDHSASHNNAAAERRQRIQMANADYYLVVMLKRMVQMTNQDLVIGTEDMRSAYRQLPIPDKQTSISITAVHKPGCEPQLFEIFGQPFGAAHSVPNFYRVAEWIARLVAKALRLVIDHFFDDYFQVCRQADHESCKFALQESFRLLGFSLDQGKSQVPSMVAHVLGVAFNTSSLREQRRLLIQPKETRKVNTLKLIDRILQDDFLPPSLAASLSGKFMFLCSTMFGKVGRCCTGAVRARQYSSSADCTLNQALRVSLSLMKLFIQQASPREFNFLPGHPPLILYTDASDVPDRVGSRSVLGAVLYNPSDQVLQYTSMVVPESLVQLWDPKQTYMAQLEILACPLALATWPSILKQRQVLHFIDNDAAAASIVRGYSPKADSSPLVGEYWLRASKANLDIYVDRVESKSNLADGPSRLEFGLMQFLGAQHAPPETSSLGHTLFSFHTLFQ